LGIGEIVVNWLLFSEIYRGAYKPCRVLLDHSRSEEGSDPLVCARGWDSLGTSMCLALRAA